MGIESAGEFIQNQHKQLEQVENKDQIETQTSKSKHHKLDARVCGLVAFEEALVKLALSTSQHQDQLGSELNMTTDQINTASTEQTGLGKSAEALSQNTGASAEQIDQQATSMQVEQQRINTTKTIATQKQGNIMFSLNASTTQLQAMNGMFTTMIQMINVTEGRNLNRARGH